MKGEEIKEDEEYLYIQHSDPEPPPISKLNKNKSPDSKNIEDNPEDKEDSYKKILEKYPTQKERIERVANYIYKNDKTYFYFSEEGRRTWIDKHYPEVKSYKGRIIKKVNELFEKGPKI